MGCHQELKCFFLLSSFSIWCSLPGNAFFSNRSLLVFFHNLQSRLTLSKSCSTRFHLPEVKQNNPVDSWRPSLPCYKRPQSHPHQLEEHEFLRHLTFSIIHHSNPGNDKFWISISRRFIGCSNFWSHPHFPCRTRDQEVFDLSVRPSSVLLPE